MTLPKDPNILLSMINMKLRDKYSTFDELCDDLDVEKAEIENIVDNLKDNISVETKSPVYIPEVTADNMLKFKLNDEATEEELEFDIDKSNDWNATDNTTGSNYVWEPMI